MAYGLDSFGVQHPFTHISSKNCLGQRDFYIVSREHSFSHLLVVCVLKALLLFQANPAIIRHMSTIRRQSCLVRQDGALWRDRCRLATSCSWMK
ncbi:hypothetical protein BJX96DRAFT_157745 [Aspergillus floccosus]